MAADNVTSPVTAASRTPGGVVRPAGVFKPLDDDAKAKVLRQVEFYFSDSNLPRDKFLRETVEVEPDGFVDISLVITFSRVRLLLTPFGGPHNDETIASVTELFQTSQELTVSDDKLRIRRTAELRPREEVDAEVEQRSVYASPFPMTSTIDELTAFFAAHCAKQVLSIRLRRHITSKDFKGSIFLELEDAPSCDELMAKSLEFDGATLTLMMKKDYMDKKKTDRVEKAAANTAAAAVEEEAANAAAAAARRQTAGEDDAAVNEKEGDDAEGGNDDAAEGTDADDVEAARPAAITEGLLLKFVLGEAAEGSVRREDLSGTLGDFGTIKFIDFKMGNTSGCIRFEDAVVVQSIMAAHGGESAELGELEMGGKPMALSVMEGEEEAAYWKALAARAGSGRGSGGGGGRGGRGGGRGRGGCGERGIGGRAGGGRGGGGFKRGNNGGDGGGGKRPRN